MAIAKKLLLVSAIALASSSAFAMQSMDDGALSETTGQDGITVTVVTPVAGISYRMNVYDTDAFGSQVNIGAITIGGDGTTGTKASIRTPTTGISLAIDAGSAAAGANPVLNIDLSVASGTVIHTGDIGVAGTATAKNTSGTFPNIVNNSIFLKDVAITLGAATATIQLGSGATNLLSLNTSMTGGLTMGCTLTTCAAGGSNITSPFQLNDNSSSGGGAFFANQIKVTDSAGTDLGVTATANLTAADGLKLTLTKLGDATNGADIKMARVGFGAASGSTATTTLGDVSVLGLNLNGTTVAIKGH